MSDTVIRVENLSKKYIFDHQKQERYTALRDVLAGGAKFLGRQVFKLVIEGVNGFGFYPEDPQQLSDLMLKMSSKEVNLTAMGQAALEHIQKFSPTYFAQCLTQAVNYALAPR